MSGLVLMNTWVAEENFFRIGQNYFNSKRKKRKKGVGRVPT